MVPEKTALVAATVLFLGGFVHALLSLRRGTYRHSWTAFGLIAAGFLCQSLFLYWRGKVLGRCPITTPYELLTFTGWAMTLFYFLVGSAYRLSLLGAFTAPLAFVLQFTALLKPDTPTSPGRPPGGMWTEMHATLSLLAYGAFGLAFVAGVMFLVQDRLLKKHTGMSLVWKLPPVHLLSRALKRLLVAGTLLLTAGILSAYRMDTLPSSEKLVLVWAVWASYAILLTYEYQRGMSCRRAAQASVVCFLLAVVSLWFVTPR